MRRFSVFGIVAVAILLALAGGMTTRQAVAGPDDVTVAMSGTSASGAITYSITVSNKGTAAIGDVYVAGAIPTGAKFDSVGTLPKGAGSLGTSGGVVAFLVTSIPANGSVALSYKVTGTSVGVANAYAAWKAPTAGSAVSAAVTQQAAVAASAPRRGCESCHVGNYTLAYEATSAGGPNHPKVASDAGVSTCLGCHGAAADRTGVAPIMLRTIVHPAHMSSDSFTTKYKGTCFTCHDVDEKGDFKLIGVKIEVNPKGIPEHLNAKGYAADAK